MADGLARSWTMDLGNHGGRCASCSCCCSCRCCCYCCLRDPDCGACSAMLPLLYGHCKRSSPELGPGGRKRAQAQAEGSKLPRYPELPCSIAPSSPGTLRTRTRDGRGDARAPQILLSLLVRKLVLVLITPTRATLFLPQQPADAPRRAGRRRWWKGGDAGCWLKASWAAGPLGCYWAACVRARRG